MQTIGLLGGLSWQSTQHYYRLINEAVAQRLGGLHSAQIALWSVDFAPIEALQHEERWEQAGALLARAAQRVEAAGADFLLLCTNTMHIVAGPIEEAIGIPLLHIADATAERLRQRGIAAAGLLGTAFTMERPFYRERLARRGALRVLTPTQADRQSVHRIIYEELCLGVLREESRAELRRIAGALQRAGAEALIAGCTEISMLLQQRHTELPLFDTTAIHAEAAVARALAPERA